MEYRRCTAIALLFLLAVASVASDSEEVVETEEEQTTIEPGDPEDIGPDAPQVTAPPGDDDTMKEELSMDEQIRKVLEHFKQEDPRGLPGVAIQDPMPIEDFEGDFTMAHIKFQEAQLYGLSKFRIDYVRTDLKDLKVHVGLSFNQLQVLGRYRMSSWLSTSSGNFNVTLIGIAAEGFVGLYIDAEGVVQASNITIDLTMRDIAMQFDNLGFFGSLFQGIINSVGAFIFDSIKPLVLGQVNDKIQTTINTELPRLIEKQLPDSVPPLDLAIALAAKKMRDDGMDPFVVPDSTHTIQRGMDVNIYDGRVEGLSTIHRSGDIVLNFENGTIIAAVQVATQRLRGAFGWELYMPILPFKPKGRIGLDIEHLDIHLGVQQSANVNKKPKLEILKLKLGNIQARSSGTGSLDYLIEFSINFLVNGLRGVILRTMEKPVRQIIQDELDKLDVEAIIEQQLAALNEI